MGESSTAASLSDSGDAEGVDGKCPRCYLGPSVGGWLLSLTHVHFLWAGRGQGKKPEGRPSPAPHLGRRAQASSAQEWAGPRGLTRVHGSGVLGTLSSGTWLVPLNS